MSKSTFMIVSTSVMRGAGFGTRVEQRAHRLLERLGKRDGVGRGVEDRRVAVAVLEGIGDRALGQRTDLGAIKIVPPRSGEAGTLGLAIEVQEDKLAVTDVRAGGPAEGAGVHVGDHVATINGIDVAALTLPIAQMRSAGAAPSS